MANSFPVSFYGFTETVAAVTQRMTGQRATADDDLIDELLAFANANETELSRFTLEAVAAAAHVDAAMSAASGHPQTILSDYTQTVIPLVRSWVRQELEKIAAGRGAYARLDSARPRVTNDSAVPGPLVTERLTGTGNAARIERRYAFASIEEFAQWTVLLSRRNGIDICRCHLPTCRRFFIAEATKGRVRRTYCSPEHMKAAQKLTASDRVMASRYGLPVAEFRKQRNRK